MKEVNRVLFPALVAAGALAAGADGQDPRPWPVAAGRMEANGITIAYESHGSVERETVLLIHGLGSPLTGWPAELLEELVKRGYRVIIYDNRDIGLSTRFEAAGEPDMKAVFEALAAGKPPPLAYTLDDLARDAVGLLDALGIPKAHIAGVSMGGMIAQLVAADHPQRVLSLASIMSTSGNPEVSLPARPEVMARVPPPAPEGDVEAAVDRAVKLLQVLGSPGYPSDEKTLREMVARSLKRSYYPAGLKRQSAAAAAGYYDDRRAKLRTIRAPAVVLHGADDPLVPVEGGKDTAANIPDAELHIVKGMGHDIPVALVKTFADAITAAASRARLDLKDWPTKDWPTYNCDVLGSRHNRGETAIGPRNAGLLEEKWRFPAAGSDLEIGVIHATPIVLGGYVYFGTATDPAFYKLTPDGKVRWSYRNPARPAAEGRKTGRKARFQPSPDGILGSALVTGDSVFFGDTGGRFYALDRTDGAERWKVNARAEGFPGAHPLNVFMASPILAGGKLVVAGGTLEQVVAAFPGYRGSTGRGFVMALEPGTGRVLWKHDLGPRPEPLDPPIIIKDSWGDHEFHFGPATSSVWCTPSFDAESGAIFFGTDVNTAPRRPTGDDPRLHTRESCAVMALDVRDGSERWVRQINPGDVWTNAMRSYDPATGRYKDQSIGDTPKVYTLTLDGAPTRVVGAGCKNGGFYVLDAKDGRILAHTPIYTGPPAYPLAPPLDPRMLALPSAIGGLQTGCAMDGTTIYTNGIDALRLGSQEKPALSIVPPTGGRVVALSLDTRKERWRHERPRIASIGGPAPVAVYQDVGDPVASGIAVANGVLYFTTVASGKLVAVEAATGAVLKEIELGPVFSGPSVSRGRVYVGTGNTLFVPLDFESYFPKKSTGVLYSFGLPGEDEVGSLGAGRE